jgi:hypothetical protein
MKQLDGRRNATESMKIWLSLLPKFCKSKPTACSIYSTSLLEALTLWTSNSNNNKKFQFWLILRVRNIYIRSNLVITNARERSFLFVITGVRYNRVNLCYKMTKLPLKYVRYNRVFVNNRVCYNRVSPY